MSWKCPSCGCQNYETFNNCACGYRNDHVSLVEREPLCSQDVSEDGVQCPDISPNCIADHNPSLQELLGTQELHPLGRPDSMSTTPHEALIKEVDSWLFTFSSIDGCIAISTPALQSFRLKVTLEDLEDLLEFLYRKTGSEKTIRKIGLEPTDVAGIIDRVNTMIEEKKSKVSLNFTNDELQEIIDIVNMQIRHDHNSTNS
jgi:hypothetical protein